MTGQLSFDDIFAAQERELATCHLPSDMEQAIPFYRSLIHRFNAALMRPDIEAERVQKEAHDLATKVNGGRMGIKAGPDASCDVLERATYAPRDSLPLWGQTGDFVVIVRGCMVLVEMDGMFDIGAMPVPGFSTHVIEPDKPFISETGYRSFIGYLTSPRI